MQTQDFATDVNGNTFVRGVVYTDTNGNGEYGCGEETANSTVSLGFTSKTTNDAGGYSFDVTRTGQTFTITAGRGDTSRHAAGEHCGLGLSLCQKVMTLLGGSISVSSATGRTFAISISRPEYLASPWQN